jgi:hypothetical protein
VIGKAETGTAPVHVICHAHAVVFVMHRSSHTMYIWQQTEEVEIGYPVNSFTSSGASPSLVPYPAEASECPLGHLPVLTCYSC